MADQPNLVLKVKRLHPDAILPVRGSKGAAGYDLFSASEETIICAHGKATIDTNLSIKVPSGYYGRIAPRSGLAQKNFIDVGAGVIDEDYRGAVKVLLFNFSVEEFCVKKGDKIAQLILEKIATPEVLEVDELDQTERGDKGFGSTGSNAASPQDQMEIDIETGYVGPKTKEMSRKITQMPSLQREEDAFQIDVDLLRPITHACFTKTHSDLTSTLTPMLEIVFARKPPLANQIKAVFDPYWKDNKFVTEIAGPELETVKQAFISMETRKEALQNANEGRQSAAAAAATTSHPF